MRDSQSMLTMMMDTELTDELKEHVRDAIGRRVRITLMGMASFELKPDKFENRILAFTACRLFVLHPKPPCKIDWTFNYLDIEAIESKTPDQLLLTVSGKLHRVRVKRENPFLDRVVEAVCGALKSIFPSVPLERVVRRVELSPAERQAALQAALQAVGETGEQGPCGGYSKMYACMCDYHNQPYRDEVAWDVDTIYHAHNNREFCLQDFDHLEASDMVPIIAALEFNTWFVGIRATHVQLSDKATEQLVKVVGKSLHLQVLQLDSMSTKPTFVRDVSMAMVSNSGTNIQSIDLSGNPIDEKGATALSGPIARAPHGLTRLNLSKTQLGSKLINSLSHSLSLNRYMTKTLKLLALSDNNTGAKGGGHGGEDLGNLYIFLAQPNAISHLDLQNTDVNLEMLFGTLHRGCTQHLTSLNVSFCAFTSSKKSRYTYVPQPSFKQFFASALALKQIDMSYVKGFTSDVLKALFLSVASNPNLNELELTLRGNELKSPMALQIMETCMPDIPCIAAIDLTDNGLDHEFAPVLVALARNQALKRLRLGRNFGQVKSKRLSVIMHALVHLLHHDASRLEALDVNECRFRHGTSLILSALGTNQHLKTIDISGNYCGNAGARVLAKALQVNTRLETIQLDRNLISEAGFEDLAWGLQHNYSLRNMSYPASDVMEAVKQTPLAADALQNTMKRIETLLWRNQNPDGYNWSERLQRLHQSAYASTSSQVVDQLLVQIQDLFDAVKRFPKYKTSTALEDHVKRCVQQADGYKQLLTRLQEVGFMSGTTSDSLDSTLRDSIGALCDTMDGELRHRVESMCQQTGVLFPDMFDKKKAFRSDLLDGARLADDFVARMRQRMDEEIRQRMREVLLETAARLSQRVFEEVVESLNCCHELLADIQKQESSTHSPTSRPHSALSSATSTATGAAAATASGAGSTSQLRQQFARQGTLESVTTDNSGVGGVRTGVAAHQQRHLIPQVPPSAQPNTTAVQNYRQMHAYHHVMANNAVGSGGQQHSTVVGGAVHHHDKDSVIYGRLIRPPSQITTDLTGGIGGAGGIGAGDGMMMPLLMPITGPFMKLSELREHAAPSPSEIPQEEPKERQKKLDHLCRDRPRPNKRRHPYVRPSRALSSHSGNTPGSAGSGGGGTTGTTGRGRRSSSSSVTLSTSGSANNTASKFFSTTTQSNATTTTTNVEEPYYGVTSANQYNMLDIGEGLDAFFGSSAPSSAAAFGGNHNTSAARRTSRQNSDSSYTHMHHNSGENVMLEESVEVVNMPSSSCHVNGGAKSSSSKEKSKRKGLFKLFTSSTTNSTPTGASTTGGGGDDSRKKSSSRSRVASSPRSPSSSSRHHQSNTESDRIIRQATAAQQQVTPPQATQAISTSSAAASRAALLNDSIQQFHAERKTARSSVGPQSSAPPTPLTPKKHPSSATPVTHYAGPPPVVSNNPFAAAVAAAQQPSSTSSPAGVRRMLGMTNFNPAVQSDVSDGAKAARTSAANVGFSPSDTVNRNLLAEMKAKHDSKQTRVMAALPERPENVAISSDSNGSSSGNSSAPNSAASTPAVNNTSSSVATATTTTVDPGALSSTVTTGKPAPRNTSSNIANVAARFAAGEFCTPTNASHTAANKPEESDADNSDTDDAGDDNSSSESEPAANTTTNRPPVTSAAATANNKRVPGNNVSQTRELLNAAFLMQQQQNGSSGAVHRIAPPPGGKLLWHPMSSGGTANGETTGGGHTPAAAPANDADLPPPLPPRNPTFGSETAASGVANNGVPPASSIGSVAAAAAAVAAASAVRPTPPKNSVPVFATGAVSQLARSKSFYTAKEAAAAPVAGGAPTVADLPSSDRDDDGSGDRAGLDSTGHNVGGSNNGVASVHNTPLLTGRGRQHNRIKERVRSLFAEADANL